MTRFVIILALLAFAGATIPAHAETDYVAKKIIEMIKDGSEGSYKGVDGILRTPRTSGMPTTSSGVGTVASGLTVVEYGNGVSHQTVITADDFSIVMAEGGTGTNGVGSAKIYDFPAGRILIEGVTVDSFAMTIDTSALDVADGGDFSFGTAAAGGTSGLASTEVDIAPSTSIDPITNITSVALAASAQFDGTTTAVDIYANTEVDDADIAAACTNTADFAITVTWKNLGDY